ncbi:MAG: thiamine pyrophosphate-dependent enzyme [Lachnospiraceae bacterium]|nr:thiamine pyrophosphate-dependent enzyme [Lachnospiraceae bacterium]
MKKEFLMGNEAIAMGALAAGVNLVAGYPGTPSSEVLETVAKRRTEATWVEWSVNEKAAMEVAAGAAYAGARVMVTMKQVGLNVASDPLMSLAYIGVKGGMVILVADDPGPISSQTEQDTRTFAMFAKVPVFDPSGVQEAYDLVQEAFAFSEKYQTPVILRPTTRVCHSYAGIDIREPQEYDVHTPDGFVKSPNWVIFPKLAQANHRKIEARNVAIGEEFSGETEKSAIGEEYSDETEKSAIGEEFSGETEKNSIGEVLSGENEKEAIGDGFAAKAENVTSGEEGYFRFGNRILPALGKFTSNRRGIATHGISFAYTMENLEQDSSPKVLKVGTPFPFPEQLALKFLEGLDEVLCIEELDPVIERALTYVCGKYHLPVRICGKMTGHVASAGENSVDSVGTALTNFFGTDFGRRPAFDLTDAPALPVRPPVLCAGCPHRAAFYAVKCAMKGKKALYSGDIGCYTLGNAAPLDMTDTCLCMGAGITVAQGIGRIEPDTVCFSFTGDSTFFASGITGIVNAFYNQANLTAVILDNSTTAMTGHQPHPGTGRTMMGGVTEKVDIEKVLRAIGLETVETVDPLNLTVAVETVRRVSAEPGVKAIIFRSPCVALPGAKIGSGNGAASKKTQTVLEKSDASKDNRKDTGHSNRPGCIRIDPEKCINCRKCIRELGCPGIVLDAGKVSNDTSLCTGCGLCAQVCPVDAIGARGERCEESL